MGRTLLPSARPPWPRALICAASRQSLLGSSIRKCTPRTLTPRCNLDIHGGEATNDSDNLPGLCSTYDDTHTEGRGKVYLRFAGGPTLGPYPYVSSPREPRNGVACH